MAQAVIDGFLLTLIVYARLAPRTDITYPSARPSFSAASGIPHFSILPAKTRAVIWCHVVSEPSTQPNSTCQRHISLGNCTHDTETLVAVVVAYVQPN